MALVLGCEVVRELGAKAAGHHDAHARGEFGRGPELAEEPHLASARAGGLRDERSGPGARIEEPLLDEGSLGAVKRLAVEPGYVGEAPHRCDPVARSQPPEMQRRHQMLTDLLGGLTRPGDRVAGSHRAPPFPSCPESIRRGCDRGTRETASGHQK